MPAGPPDLETNRTTGKSRRQRRPPTGTVTLLFTDIEGSTRLVDELGPELWPTALERHRFSVARKSS
jgi:class 3 adenylate cyclase